MTASWACHQQELLTQGAHVVISVMCCRNFGTASHLFLAAGHDSEQQFYQLLLQLTAYNMLGRAGSTMAFRDTVSLLHFTNLVSSSMHCQGRRYVCHFTK